MNVQPISVHRRCSMCAVLVVSMASWSGGHTRRLAVRRREANSFVWCVNGLCRISACTTARFCVCMRVTLFVLQSSSPLVSSGARCFGVMVWLARQGATSRAISPNLRRSASAAQYEAGGSIGSALICVEPPVLSMASSGMFGSSYSSTNGLAGGGPRPLARQTAVVSIRSTFAED